jgi:hypothetical protein
MTRYADPQRCPDCLGPIEYGALSCPTCGLNLRGDLAQQLFRTLSTADDLLVALRAVPATQDSTRSDVPARVGEQIGSPRTGTAARAAHAHGRSAGGPATSVMTATAATEGVPSRYPERKGGLTAASVPKILLTLGAGCLLVAALVFLAVSWSALGVAGRTATLVMFTVVAAGLTAWVARRGLRGAAESLSLVALGLLTLDIFGARHAGWFGDVSTPSFLVLLGIVLAVAGAATAVQVRRTGLATLTGAQVVAAMGTGLTAGGIGTLHGLPASPAWILAVLAAGALTAALHRVGLRTANTLGCVATVLAWLALNLVALVRAFDHPTLRELWGHAEVWPVLAAVALAFAAALLRTLPTVARVGAAGLGYLLLTVAVTVPALAGSPTQLMVAVTVALLVTAVLTLIAPSPWSAAGVPAQLLGGVGLAGLLLGQAGASLERMSDVVSTGWAGHVGDVLAPSGYTGMAAGWVLPLGVLALVGTAIALWHTSRPAAKVPGLDPTLAAAVVVATTMLTLALYPVPVWLLVAVPALAAAGLLGWWLQRQEVEPAQQEVAGGESVGPQEPSEERHQNPAAAWALIPLLLGIVLLLAALALSLHDEWLTAGALVVTLATTATVHLRARRTEVAAIAGALFAPAVAGAAWTVGALVDGDTTWVALIGLLLLGALAVAAPFAPRPAWRCPDPVWARTGLELGAAGAAIPLALAGVTLAPVSEPASWAAVYLTVAGVAVSAMSLLRTDRRELGWLGGALLALASWVRLGDIGVHQPEAYTLPSATALLAVGLVHLHRGSRASTMTALAPGLGLALVPSLLWALADPTGLRPLLLGLGCLALVVAGLQLRWTAPLSLGATAGALLVLRLAAPYIGDAVPRWVLIGCAGALLIAVGVTWERRLQDARQVMRYVRRLR